MLPAQKIRLVAGTPIDAGDRRLLPSVLVTTMTGGDGSATRFGYVKVRPTSIVEEGPDGARWLEIPNATLDAINTMAAAGLGIALAGMLIILLLRLARGRSSCC